MARHAMCVLPLLLLASSLFSAVHAAEMRPRDGLAGPGGSNNQFIGNHEPVTPVAVITPRPNDPEPNIPPPEPVTAASDPVTTPNPASAPQDVFTDDPFGTSAPSHSNAGPSFDPNDPLGGRDPLAGDNSKTGVQQTSAADSYAGTVQPNQVNSGIPITPNIPDNNVTPNFPDTPDNGTTPIFPDTPGNDTTPVVPDTPNNVTETGVAQNSSCDPSDLDGYTSSYQITKFGHVLHWAVVSPTVVKIAFEAKHGSGAAAGWISVGFSKDGKMKKADAIIGNLPDEPIAAYSMKGYDADSIKVNKDLWIAFLPFTFPFPSSLPKLTRSRGTPRKASRPSPRLATSPSSGRSPPTTPSRSPSTATRDGTLAVPPSIATLIQVLNSCSFAPIRFALLDVFLSAHLDFLFAFSSRSGSFEVDFSCNGAGGVAAQQTVPVVAAQGGNVTVGSSCTQSTLSEFDHQADLYDGK
ncbi:unnamed protein product [Closterium sp. NIES-54]